MIIRQHIKSIDKLQTSAVQISTVQIGAINFICMHSLSHVLVIVTDCFRYVFALSVHNRNIVYDSAERG